MGDLVVSQPEHHVDGPNLPHGEHHVNCPMMLRLSNNQRNEAQPDQLLIPDKRLFCAAEMPISRANPWAAMVTGRRQSRRREAAVPLRGFLRFPSQGKPQKTCTLPQKGGEVVTGSPVHTWHRDYQSSLAAEALPCHWTLRPGFSKFLINSLRYY